MFILCEYKLVLFELQWNVFYWFVSVLCHSLLLHSCLHWVWGTFTAHYPPSPSHFLLKHNAHLLTSHPLPLWFLTCRPSVRPGASWAFSCRYTCVRWVHECNGGVMSSRPCFTASASSRSYILSTLLLCSLSLGNGAPGQVWYRCQWGLSSPHQFIQLIIQSLD